MGLQLSLDVAEYYDVYIGCMRVKFYVTLYGADKLCQIFDCVPMHCQLQKSDLSAECGFILCAAGCGVKKNLASWEPVVISCETGRHFF